MVTARRQTKILGLGYFRTAHRRPFMQQQTTTVQLKIQRDHHICELLFNATLVIGNLYHKNDISKASKRLLPSTLTRYPRITLDLAVSSFTCRLKQTRRHLGNPYCSAFVSGLTHNLKPCYCLILMQSPMVSPNHV